MVGWLKKFRKSPEPKVGYPETCIKGISIEDGVTEDGQVLGHVFHFKEGNDGWVDQSINWEDDPNAQDFTLRQTKNEKIQWKVGIAILPRKAVDQLNESLTYNDLLSYERDTLKNNKYHGNILLKNKVARLAMKAIAGNLATNVTKFIPQKYK